MKKTLARDQTQLSQSHVNTNTFFLVARTKLDTTMILGRLVRIRCSTQQGRIRDGGNLLFNLGTSSSQFSTRIDEEKISNVDLIRLWEKDKEKEPARPSQFRLITDIGLITDGKVHKLEVSSDKIIQLIKMNIVNKNLGAQYCHYLVHLSKTAVDSELKQFYGRKAYELMSYLIRQGRDLLGSSKLSLICDVSQLSPSICSRICDEIIDQLDSMAPIQPVTLRELLGSCYRFALYKCADKIIKLYPATLSPIILDTFVLGLFEFSLEYKQSAAANLEIAERKQQFLNHLSALVEQSARDGIQFITKYREDFIEALKNLDISVTKNPPIKLSSRCVNCDTHLPSYDSKLTKIINESIKSLLEKKIDSALLYTSPEDLASFEEFLRKAYEIDDKPFDCVIDGLNVAYQNATGFTVLKHNITEDFQRTTKRISPDSLAQVLINTVIRGNFKQKFRKILVIGRKHMERWPGVTDFFENQKIHYYFSFNHNKDDLFTLYAATLSPKTVLITNDFLRDHRALMSKKDRINFERWLDTRQAWIAKKSLKPIWPTPMQKLPSFDKEAGLFHIPIIDSNRLVDLAQHDPPPHLNSNMVTWLCCKT